MRIVAAPDKFKGTATAQEVSEAIATAVESAGHECTQVPMADGGEGTLAALGGANRSSLVTGPLGDPVTAEWRYDQGTAVLEMAQSSGLVLAGGKEANDPLSATTSGVGELISEAVDAGATRIIIGVGGSATTDGGLGAIEALGGAPARLKGVEVIVACDVRTSFVDAATVFGPQKGASSAQVSMLTNRLTALVDEYRSRFKVDVSKLERGGAAGGLAGGLAAVGATLVDGFDIVSDVTGLGAALVGADMVITGEGGLDAESFDGKVVGGVVRLSAEHDLPVLAVAGQVFDGAERQVAAVSLADEFGLDRALSETLSCITQVVGAKIDQAFND